MTTLETKKLIIEKLENGLTVHQIAQELGVSKGSVGAIKAHVTMGSYRGLDVAEEAEILDAVETTFGLEKDLQKALRENISQLEVGLQIADGGKELAVASGFTDIVAKDAKGTLVIIELKAGEAKPAALTQLLSYMRSVAEEGVLVRGILVASDFDIKIIQALRVVKNVELRKYRFKFKFDAVGA